MWGYGSVIFLRMCWCRCLAHLALPRLASYSSSRVTRCHDYITLQSIQNIWIPDFLVLFWREVYTLRLFIGRMGCGMVYRSVVYAYWVWVSGICRVENTPPKSVEALKKSHRKLSKIEDIDQTFRLLFRDSPPAHRHTTVHSTQYHWWRRLRNRINRLVKNQLNPETRRFNYFIPDQSIRACSNAYLFPVLPLSTLKFFLSSFRLKATYGEHRLGQISRSLPFIALLAP